MRNKIGFCIALSPMLLLGSCQESSSPSKTATAPTTLTGHVMLSHLDGTRVVAGAAVVQATGDFDGDGSITADESVSSTADPSGHYQLEVKARDRTHLVVSFSMAGALPNMKVVQAGDGASFRVDADVFESEPLTHDGVGFTLPGGALRVDGLPKTLKGTARVYNPVHEADAFPGDFRSSSGKRLISAVFSAYEFRDAGDNPITDFSNATVRLAVPKDTWRVIRDVTPGNGQIDVPWWYFDQTRGVWVADGSAHLVDESGNKLAEPDVTSIAQGSFVGKVFVVAKATQSPSPSSSSLGGLSALLRTQADGNGASSLKPVTLNNVDFEQPGGFAFGAKAKKQRNIQPYNPNKKKQPQDPPPKCDGWLACKMCSVGLDVFCSDAGGLVRLEASTDGALEPLANTPYTANLFLASDGTFLGHVTGYTGASGEFELPLPLSEPAGVDIDGNGLTGEVYEAYITLDWEGIELGLFKGEMPTQIAPVVDWGALDLTASALTPDPCAIQGTVTDTSGNPLANVPVTLRVDVFNAHAEDPSVCGQDGALCPTETTSAADGTFSLSYPISVGFQLHGSLEPGAGVGTSYEGATHWFGCPSAPTNLVLEAGETNITAKYSMSGQTITWTPATQPVTRLDVISAAGETKWRLASEGPAGFVGPVTFGVPLAGTLVEHEVLPGVTLEAATDTIILSGYFIDSYGNEIYVTSAPASP